MEGGKLACTGCQVMDNLDALIAHAREVGSFEESCEFIHDSEFAPWSQRAYECSAFS